MTISTRDLIEKMGTKLPLSMEFPDPMTGEPFTVNRDNMLALLAIDCDHLVLESQTVAMMFGEMARVHAAAKMAKLQIDAQFRSWQAQKSMEARSKLDGGMTTAKVPVKKPPTADQIKEFYRTHPDYAEQYRAVDRMAVIVDLLADLKQGFRMKQGALHDLHSVTFGHDQVQASDDRLAEMAEAIKTRAIPMMLEAGTDLAEIVAGRLPFPGGTDTATAPKSTKTAKRPTRPKGTKT